jgi:hypothetical protein
MKAPIIGKPMIGGDAVPVEGLVIMGPFADAAKVGDWTPLCVISRTMPASNWDIRLFVAAVGTVLLAPGALDPPPHPATATAARKATNPLVSHSNLNPRLRCMFLLLNTRCGAICGDGKRRRIHNAGICRTHSPR